MPEIEILFDGIFVRNNIQYIRFKNKNTNNIIDIPIEDKIALQIKVYLQKIAPNDKMFEAGNDEESI